jgi:2-polyprenyl-3-methyl-5-hydroxy-6-metoxy-1,4-benzoquinol methylase
MAVMPSRRLQAAFEAGADSLAPAAASDLSTTQELIYSATYRCQREDLGLPEEVARARAKAEISGAIGRNICDECEEAGLTFGGQTVLDLGAGMGGLSAEMSRRGAKVISIEPGTGWRHLAAQRLGTGGRVVGAVGEHLPLADGSVDLIVSLQVLEHTQKPDEVIREAFRVLKPGGYLYLSYENYLSFWEPHYKIRWLPLLPKPIGSFYLRRLGRSPKFLNEAITYTTFPSVRRTLIQAGFECMRQKEFRDALASPSKSSAKWKLLKALAFISPSLPVLMFSAADYNRRIFKTSAWEFLRKPGTAE